MASSLPCNIPPMLEFIAKNIFKKFDVSKFNPTDLGEGKPLTAVNFSILDVGMGFGKWGFLIRDSFDVMTFQKFTKDDWTIKITGIEPFTKAITPIQKALYNEIITKDFFKCIDDLGKFDLVILGDVIEHFPKEEGYKVLDKLFEHTNNVLVSTPKGFLPQGAWGGNEKEVHLSGWELNDFDKYHVVDSEVVEDNLFTDIIKSIPNIPEEMKKPTDLLVVWLSKK